MLLEPVTKGWFSPVEVDVLLGEDVSHARGARGGLAEQPVIAFLLVDHDDLLGYPVVVAEAHLQHAPVGRGREILVGVLSVEFVQTPLQKTPVADPVGPDHRAEGDTPLSQPPGVLKSSSRSLDLVQRHVVLENVQQCGDIFRDARLQNFNDGCVAPELGDLGNNILPYVAADLREV
jgi:hypothetical protein